ncbi:MAG: hypothetical protein LBG80_16115 [Bacteroidales bacterium]|jgi:hypothetical protein|nr:hypothetical protein [Bacteroidales bacterium]
MQDWKQILLNIYTPEMGSIWAVYNGIWNNLFAANKNSYDYHPAVVGKINEDKISCKIIPGTTKDYQKGTGVFKVRLNTYNPDYKITHFLLNLWMTISNKELLKMKRGWNGIETLSETQIKELKLQIKIYWEIDV